MRRLLLKILLVLASLSISFCVIEIALRIKNPFNKNPRVRHGKILLPSSKASTYESNVPGLPKVVEKKRRNSIGFRGSEPPQNFDDWLTVVTVGGSTTECGYTSDGSTWTDLVGMRLSKCFDRFWINNAGLDGHTTIGHLELLRNYVIDLKPDVIIFLIGRNDSVWPETSRFDRNLGTLGKGPLSFSSFREFVKSVGERSETVTSALVTYRRLRARRRGSWQNYVDWRSLEEGEAYPPGGKELLAEIQSIHIPRYKEQIGQIISVTRKNEILAVFVTQPMPFARTRDPDIGKDLSRIMFGAFEMERIELYNNALREVTMSQDVPLVDLARRMPKRTSLFWDVVHFTTSGEEMVSDIISQDLSFILNDRVAPAKGDCL